MGLVDIKTTKNVIFFPLDLSALCDSGSKSLLFIHMLKF